MPEDLERTIIEIVARKKRIDPARVRLDSTFEELGIDSLDGMDLLFEFEETFNVTIPDEAARGMRSVRQVADGLREALAAQPPRQP